MKKIAITFIVLALVGIAAWVAFEKKVGTVEIPNKAEISTGTSTTGNTTSTGLEVPEGFAINLYADDISGARVMAIDPSNRLIVSQTKEGSIIALEDPDGDGQAEKRTVLVTGLDNPHGLAFKCVSGSCNLYVAEHGSLSRYDYDSEALRMANREKVLDISRGVTDRHKTRTLLFLPAPDDNILLISVGSSCDVCVDKGMRSKIIAFDTSTNTSSEYATGLRNAVFMALHPSGEVYATEMGRDGLGDDLPPDEINIIKEGQFYGWPWYYGKSVVDKTFSESAMPNTKPISSFIDIPAHSAPLGLSFIPSEGWDRNYRNKLLVAYHGSWNRSVPTGYKVMRMLMDSDGTYQGEENFITGWLTGSGEKIGRPADVLALPGGIVFVTDDGRGAVYRVTKK